MNQTVPSINQIYGGGCHALKFSSPTCEPCKKVAPKFESLSKDKRFSSVSFWEIDVSKPENAEIASKMFIKMVPIVVIVKDGENKGILSGQKLISKDAMEEVLISVS